MSDFREPTTSEFEIFKSFSNPKKVNMQVKKPVRFPAQFDSSKSCFSKTQHRSMPPQQQHPPSPQSRASQPPPQHSGKTGERDAVSHVEKKSRDQKSETQSQRSSRSYRSKQMETIEEEPEPHYEDRRSYDEGYTKKSKASVTPPNSEYPELFDAIDGVQAGDTQTSYDDGVHSHSYTEPENEGSRTFSHLNHNSAQQRSEIEIFDEKRYMLEELHEIYQSHPHLKKLYSSSLTLRDSLSDIQFEYEYMKEKVKRDAILSVVQDAMGVGFYGIEALNKKAGSVLKLDGWAEIASAERHKFNHPLQKIYKRRWRNSANLTPAQEIGMIIGASMLQHHGTLCTGGDPKARLKNVDSEESESSSGSFMNLLFSGFGKLKNIFGVGDGGKTEKGKSKKKKHKKKNSETSSSSSGPETFESIVYDEERAGDRPIMKGPSVPFEDEEKEEIPDEQPMKHLAHRERHSPFPETKSRSGGSEENNADRKMFEQTTNELDAKLQNLMRRQTDFANLFSEKITDMYTHMHQEHEQVQSLHSKLDEMTTNFSSVVDLMSQNLNQSKQIPSQIQMVPPPPVIDPEGVDLREETLVTSPQQNSTKPPNQQQASTSPPHHTAGPPKDAIEQKLAMQFDNSLKTEKVNTDSNEYYSQSPSHNNEQCLGDENENIGTEQKNIEEESTIEYFHEDQMPPLQLLESPNPVIQGPDVTTAETSCPSNDPDQICIPIKSASDTTTKRRRSSRKKKESSGDEISLTL